MENPSQFKDPERPVEQVSFDTAQEFCQKLQAALENREGAFRRSSAASDRGGMGVLVSGWDDDVDLRGRDGNPGRKQRAGP